MSNKGSFSLLLLCFFLKTNHSHFLFWTGRVCLWFVLNYKNFFFTFIVYKNRREKKVMQECVLCDFIKKFFYWVFAWKTGASGAWICGKGEEDIQRKSLPFKNSLRLYSRGSRLILRKRILKIETKWLANWNVNKPMWILYSLFIII